MLGRGTSTDEDGMDVTRKYSSKGTIRLLERK